MVKLGTSRFEIPRINQVPRTQATPELRATARHLHIHCRTVSDVIRSAMVTDRQVILEDGSILQDRLDLQINAPALQQHRLEDTLAQMKELVSPDATFLKSIFEVADSAISVLNGLAQYMREPFTVGYVDRTHRKIGPKLSPYEMNFAYGHSDMRISAIAYFLGMYIDPIFCNTLPQFLGSGLTFTRGISQSPPQLTFGALAALQIFLDPTNPDEAFNIPGMLTPKLAMTDEEVTLEDSYYDIQRVTGEAEAS